MKVKELIGVLQACNPESEVLCDWRGESEFDKDYRKACCWLSLNDEMPKGVKRDTIKSFSINGASLEDADAQGMDGLACTLSIDQDLYCNGFVADTIKELKKSNDAK